VIAVVGASVLVTACAGCGPAARDGAPRPNPSGALVHCLHDRLGFEVAETPRLPFGAVDGASASIGRMRLDVLLARDPEAAVKLEQSLDGSSAGRKSNVVLRTSGGRLDPLLRSHLVSCFA
jgi:hypothetical protein